MGADPAIVNKKGKTAFEVAKRRQAPRKTGVGHGSRPPIDAIICAVRELFWFAFQCNLLRKKPAVLDFRGGLTIG